MADLRDVVKQCAERLERYGHPQRLGEQNTKANLIEPIIDALGWDIYDPDEVHREYRRLGSDNPVDYALLLRTPRLFIEAKGLGQNLGDRRWVNQMIVYASSAGVEWVVLTNGLEWRVYNAHARVPIDQKLFWSVRLDDPDKAVELLRLLSKENMRNNRIDEISKGVFADRQVCSELVSMFAGAEPSAELVEMLDRRLPNLTGDDIRSSLSRARATFDFPGPAGTPLPASAATTRIDQPPTIETAPPSAEVSGSAAAASARSPVSVAERRIRVVDMIDAGRLSPGAVLRGHYRRVTYEAELLADGRVRYRGEVYASLSAAGRAVKVSVIGVGATESKVATDGMDFWRTTDAREGDVVSIKEIRRRAARDMA